MLRATAARLPVKMLWITFMPVDTAADVERPRGEPRPWFGRPEVLWRLAKEGSFFALPILTSPLGRTGDRSCCHNRRYCLALPVCQIGWPARGNIPCLACLRRFCGGVSAGPSVVTLPYSHCADAVSFRGAGHPERDRQPAPALVQIFCLRSPKIQPLDGVIRFALPWSKISLKGQRG